MKKEIRQKPNDYKHPETDPQVREFECICCGHHSGPIRGVWSTALGRWYLGFTCRTCETYQSEYVSEPHTEEKEEKGTKRLAFAENE